MKNLCAIMLLLLCASCSGSYWQVTKRTPSGKHHYMKNAWPYQASCNGMYTGQPIKTSSLRKYHFAKKHVRQ